MSALPLGEEKIIIGMVHLRPLIGSPAYEGNWSWVCQRALEDAKALEAGGVDALLIQNRWDQAFVKDRSPPEVVAAVTWITQEIVRAVKLPVGVHLLRNDLCGSLAVAKVCGGQFIRAACVVGATYLPQGVIEAHPREVLHYRKRIGAEEIQILADIRSMHYHPLLPTPVEAVAQQAVALGLADAVVVASPDTQEAMTMIRAIKGVDPGLPVLVGGYARKENIRILLEKADGAIVGRAFERDERGGLVVVEKVQEFMAIVHSVRGKEQTG